MVLREYTIISRTGHWLIIYLKKVFIEKEKTKVINVLTAFFFSISHESGVKVFLKWIVIQYP